MPTLADARIREWNATDLLDEPEDVIAYLEAAFEDGDPNLVTAALGDVARSTGMKALAARTGLGRESLYKALSSSGNPRFTTVLKVMQALGIRLHPVMASPTDAPRIRMDQG